MEGGVALTSRFCNSSPRKNSPALWKRARRGGVGAEPSAWSISLQPCGLFVVALPIFWNIFFPCDIHSSAFQLTFPFRRDSVQMTPFCAHRGKVGEAPKRSLIPAPPRREGSWVASSVCSHASVSCNYLQASSRVSEVHPKGHGKPRLETQASLVLETQLPKKEAPPPLTTPPLCGRGGREVGCVGMLICWPPGKELRGPGGVLSEDNE